jgi:hypothetical protein
MQLSDTTRSVARRAAGPRQTTKLPLTMHEELVAVVVDIGRMVLKSIPISLALAAVFTVLTQFWACNPGRPWWRKRDLVTDLCYWFFIPVVTRCRSR